jgi:hypothetical protein
MDANLDTIAKDLYGKIQTRFPDIRIGDEEANVLSKKRDIPKARFFEFEYKEDGDEIGTISVTLDADEGVVLEVSGDIVTKKHHGAFKFIRSFRQFAKDRLLKYDVKRMGKSNLDKRDYAFRSKVKDDMIMENKLFGTSKMSYQDLGEARLIIKHSQQINPELAAGRTMHIENIYIENAMGERFRYPVKHLNGARALAEHIKAGGHPYDGIGQHITGLSEELASLRKFKNYVGRQAQLSEAMGDITSKVMERIEAVKKEIHFLQRPTYYQQFAESFVEHEDQMIPEAVMDDWIDRLTIRTFNEELKSVFPYIFKLIDESELPVRELTADDLLAEDDNVAPWYKDKEEQDADKSKSPFKKKHNPNRTGSDTAKALAQKGMPKKEGFNPEQAFEDFMNGILPEDGDTTQPLGGIFDPKQRDSAVAELNDIFKTELKGGPDDINLNKVKELIPDPEFASMLDQLSGTGDLDMRSGIEVILNQMSEHNKDLADLIQSGQLQFSSPEDGDMPVGGQDMPPPEAPPEPAAPEAPAEPAAPEAPPVAESMGMGKLKAKLIKAVECGAGPDTELDFGSKKMTLMGALKECGIDPASIGMKTRSSDGNGVQEILKSISGFWNKDATITEGNFTKGGTWTKQHVVSNFKNGEYENATPDDVRNVCKMIDRMDPPSSIGGSREQAHILKLAGVPQRAHTVDEDNPGMGDYGDAWSTDDDGSSDSDNPASAADYRNGMDIASDQFPTDNGELDHHEKQQVQQAVQQNAPMSQIGQMMKTFGIQMPKLPGMNGEEGEELRFDDMGPQIQQWIQNMTKSMPNATGTNSSSGMINGKPASFDDAMSKFKGMGGSMNPQDMMKNLGGNGGSMPDMGGMMKGQSMDFKPGNQADLLQVDNPEYVARRAAALQKPGAVVGHTTVTESAELTAMLKIAGLR